MTSTSAMRQALECYRRPKAFNTQSGQPLPEDMLEVIKLLGNDEDVLSKWQGLTGAPSAHLQEAAKFYIQHILTHAAGNDFRQLGLNPGASPELQRKHKRALLKWLHPDVNPSKWQTALFQRVVQAADNLEKLSAPPVEKPASTPESGPSGKGVFSHKKTFTPNSNVLNPRRNGGSKFRAKPFKAANSTKVKPRSKIRKLFWLIRRRKFVFLALVIFVAGFIAFALGLFQPILTWVN